MARLDLPSADITILVLKNGFNFITRGIGSGYGLSLVGANALAKLDCNYKQILENSRKNKIGMNELYQINSVLLKKGMNFSFEYLARNNKEK